MNYRTITRRLEGKVKPCRRDRRSIFYRPKEVLPVLYGAPEVVPLMEERARLAREQADGQALRNLEVRGDLVRADEVVAEWQSVLLALKERLRAIPSKARERLKLTRVQAKRLLRLIDQALEELAEDGGTS